MNLAVSRSVRDFVAPLEPRGDLDLSLSFQLEEDAAAQGIRLHGRIQARLLREHPGAVKERALDWTLDLPGLACRIRGRVDLHLPGPEPVVEEIKTTLRPAALLRALAADPEHPFLRQARMYAFLAAQADGAVPACRLRVASLLDGAETLLPVPFDLEAWTAFVRAQGLGVLAQERAARARTEERRALAGVLDFPFPEPRPGQARLRAVVAEALEAGEPLLLQAPTGLGKTAAVLHPALERALREDRRVFYLTPRNSQQAAATAFLARLRAAGRPVRWVTLRAKEKVCPQPVVHCTPEACPRARGHYDRLAESGALAQLAELGAAEPGAVAALADAHGLCPFELALDAARGADVVVGDYNHGLSPTALGRFFGDAEAQARNLLLVDEAHQLPGRAAEWFSPVLDLEELKALKAALRGRGAAAFRRAAGRCLDLVAACAGPRREVDLDPAPFLEAEAPLGAALAKAAAAGTDLAPDHPMVRLRRRWSEFCEVLRVRTGAHPVTWTPPGRLQVACLDAAAHLGERFRAAAGAVLFSGTLKPFEATARRCGLDAPRCEEAASPFPADHRCLLLVPQVTTRLHRRAAAAPRVAEFLARVLPLRHGNYLVCFPSFDFLEATAPLLDLPGFRVLAQPRRAAAADLEAILSALRGERGLVVLAVQGGSLAEGVDLPGEALIGCVVVGPALPPPDLERRLARAYFDRQGGGGEALTATYPAMARAVQAAGRVIRGPEERGLLAFLDDRFLAPDFARCFPADWFPEGPRPAAGILARVARFWEGA